MTSLTLGILFRRKIKKLLKFYNKFQKFIPAILYFLEVNFTYLMIIIINMPLDKKGLIERYYKKLTGQIARKIVHIDWITPNRITFAAFILAGVITPLLIITNHLILAAIFFIIGNFLDNLDGDLARARNTLSPEGAIFDAVLDRYVDLFTLTALVFVSKGCEVWGFFAIIGSCLVPYIRARTEAEGKKSVQTVASRDVRNFIITLGLIFNAVCLTLMVIAILSNISALHRFIHAMRK